MLVYWGYYGLVRVLFNFIQCMNTWVDLRHCMGRNFVTIRVQILDLTVVSPFVRNVECGGNGTAVRVDSAFFEKVHVQAFIQIVDRVVES